MHFNLHKILIWRIRKMYVNGRILQRSTTIFGQTQTSSHFLYMPSLGNDRVRHYVYFFFRCCASEIDTDAMHNLDNSIKVNMFRVVKIWRKITHLCWHCILYGIGPTSERRWFHYNACWKPIKTDFCLYSEAKTCFSQQNSICEKFLVDTR